MGVGIKGRVVVAQPANARATATHAKTRPSPLGGERVIQPTMPEISSLAHRPALRGPEYWTVGAPFAESGHKKRTARISFPQIRNAKLSERDAVVGFLYAAIRDVLDADTDSVLL